MVERRRQHSAARLIVAAALAVATSASAQDRGLQPAPPQAAPAFDAPRTALVIGNGRYRAGPLKNPNADAKLVAASLRSVGFDVDERHDLNREEMVRAIRRFGARLKDGGVGVFYFAGHGMQVDGRSYLIPIGAHIAVEDDVGLEGVDAARVLARMDEAQNDVNVVVLDACRNNPIASVTRSREGGLAFLDAPTGTLIAYATAPGRVAADGAGEHSLYSLAFAEELRRPGLRVEDVFKRVRKRVRTASRGKQVPWESSSLEGDFFFLPEGSKASTIAPVTAAPPEEIIEDPEQYYTTMPAEDAANASADDTINEDDGYRLGSAAEEEMSDAELERVLEEQKSIRADNVRYAQLKDELNEDLARQSLAGWTATGCLGLGASSCLISSASAVALWYTANQNAASDQTSEMWAIGQNTSCCAFFGCSICILPGFAGALGFGTWWLFEGENVEATTLEIVRLDPTFGKEEQLSEEDAERAQSY